MQCPKPAVKSTKNASSKKGPIKFAWPNMSEAMWQPQCQNVTTDNFNPTCLPQVLVETNDTRIFDFAQMCGLHATSFVHLNVKDNKSVNRNIVNVIFHNLLVAVAHFLLGIMGTNLILFHSVKKTTVKDVSEVSPCAIYWCGPGDDAPAGEDEPENQEEPPQEEEGQGEEKKPSCFACVKGFLEDWALVIFSVAMLLVAIGTALTAAERLLSGVGEFWWRTLGLGMGPYCYLSVASQVVYFGDTADYLTLSTFTIMDMLPLMTMVFLTCGMQSVWSAWCSVLCLGDCIVSFFMGIVHCFEFIFSHIWAFIVKICSTLLWLITCQCFPALWNWIKCIVCCPCTCINILVQCCVFCFWECGYCFSHFSCTCCCYCCLSAPYIGTAAALIVLMIGVPMLAITVGYTIVNCLATIGMAVALVAFFFLLFVSVFWVLNTVLVVLSFPLRLVGKGLEFRGPKAFTRGYFVKLCNGLFSKAGQEMALKYLNYERISKRMMEFHSRTKQATATLRRRMSQSLAPSQQQMLGDQITLIVDGEGMEVGRHTPFHESLPDEALGMSIFWKETMLDPYHTPADYGFRESEDPPEIELRSPVDNPFTIFHPPPAEACISKVTGKFDWRLALVKKFQSISKAWGGGMIVGPGVLLVFLLVVSVAPPAIQNVMVYISGDISWKLCGPFSVTQSACNSLDGEVAINGCSCLSCDDTAFVTGVEHCGAIDQCGTEGNKNNCFGWHFQDFHFPAIDGNCSCSNNVLMFNPKTVHSIYDTSEFYQSQRVQFKIEINHPEAPPAISIFHFECASFMASVRDMTSMLHFALVDCLWAMVMDAVVDTETTYAWLRDEFYTAENLMVGALGWIKCEELNFDQTQMGVLLGRAWIALSVGVIAALESMRI